MRGNIDDWRFCNYNVLIHFVLDKLGWELDSAARTAKIDYCHIYSLNITGLCRLCNLCEANGDPSFFVDYRWPLSLLLAGKQGFIKRRLVKTSNVGSTSIGVSRSNEVVTLSSSTRGPLSPTYPFVSPVAVQLHRPMDSDKISVPNDVAYTSGRSNAVKISCIVMDRVWALPLCVSHASLFLKRAYQKRHVRQSAFGVENRTVDVCELLQWRANAPDKTSEWGNRANRVGRLINDDRSFFGFVVIG
jgi:hypothetical protein